MLPKEILPFSVFHSHYLTFAIQYKLCLCGAIKARGEDYSIDFEEKKKE